MSMPELIAVHLLGDKPTPDLRNASRKIEAVPCIFRFDFGDGNGVRSIRHPGFACECGAMLPLPMFPGHQVCTCPECHAVHPIVT